MSDPGIRVVAGLGNPGPEYAEHRHNIGFRAVMRLAERWGLVFGASDAPDADVLAASGVRFGAEAHLLLPQRYMNRSGQALRAWSRRTGIALSGAPEAAPVAAEEEAAEAVPSGPAPVRPLIVCDDLSLPLGSIRLRAQGSSGGQNGLESIIDQLGGEVFPRLRLGIAPGRDEVPPEQWVDLVLTPFSAPETEAVEELVERAADVIECWCELGTEQAASRHNRRVRPSAD